MSNRRDSDREDHEAVKQENLFRFISKKLNLTTVVAKDNDRFVIQLVRDGEVVGKRRLAKSECCRSEPSCVGTVPIAAPYQLKYELPSFVHVSLCYDKLSEFFDNQNQRYPRTL